MCRAWVLCVARATCCCPEIDFRHFCFFHHFFLCNLLPQIIPEPRAFALSESLLRVGTPGLAPAHRGTLPNPRCFHARTQAQQHRISIAMAPHFERVLHRDISGGDSVVVPARKKARVVSGVAQPLPARQPSLRITRDEAPHYC